jgi:mannose-1-phosphate guanylyltransferase
VWHIDRGHRVVMEERHMPRPAPRRRVAVPSNADRARRAVRPWTILLAAGEGREFGDFSIRMSGKNIPKQFWSLGGQGGMLDWALARAGRLSPAERTIAISRAGHLRWAAPALRGLPAGNVLMQPLDRGTAPGILLSLMLLGRLDPDAVVVLLPCDHHVEGEGMLAEAIAAATGIAARRSDLIVVLGAPSLAGAAESPWLVPGALASTGITIARRSTLIALFTATVPDLVADCVTFGVDWMDGRASLRSLYDGIPPRDFNRQVLYAAPTSLAVAEIPPCGFTDLGSPAKLAKFLRDQATPLRPAFLRRALSSTARASA